MTWKRTGPNTYEITVPDDWPPFDRAIIRFELDHDAETRRTATVLTAKMEYGIALQHDEDGNLSDEALEQGVKSMEQWYTIASGINPPAEVTL